MALWSSRRIVSTLLRPGQTTLLSSCAFSTRSSVSTWGTGGHGQLGHGPFKRSGMFRTYEELVPKRLEAFEGTAIKQLELGAYHSAALDEHGKLYMWGSNEYNKLGLGPDAAKIEPYPRLVEVLSGIEIVDVSCGEHHTAAVDREGKVYTWGWGGSFFQGAGGLGHPTRSNVATPQLVRSLVDQGVAVASIECGGYHTVALTHDGEVLTWGHGEGGQLGHGWGENRNEPKAVELLARKTAVGIAAGCNLTIAKTSTGELYGFGANERKGGGMGLGSVPTVLSVFAGKRIRQFSCGFKHSGVVTDDGALFLCEQSVEPMRILQGEQIKQVACGYNFTAALSANGKVFTVGAGRSSFLGHGSRWTEYEPRQVEALADERVTSIVCGTRHMGVTVS